MCKVGAASRQAGIRQNVGDSSVCGVICGDTNQCVWLCTV